MASADPSVVAGGTLYLGPAELEVNTLTLGETFFSAVDYYLYCIFTRLQGGNTERDIDIENWDIFC